jgi:hypothetical protein
MHDQCFSVGTYLSHIVTNSLELERVLKKPFNADLEPILKICSASVLESKHQPNGISGLG